VNPVREPLLKLKVEGAVSRLTCCSRIAIKETQNVISYTCKNGIKQPAVTWLLEALCYKPEGSDFDSR
jgi:hypothetical protein